MRETWNRAWWKKGCSGEFSIHDLPGQKEQLIAEAEDIADAELYLEGIREGFRRAKAAIQGLEPVER